MKLVNPSTVSRRVPRWLALATTLAFSLGLVACSEEDAPVKTATEDSSTTTDTITGSDTAAGSDAKADSLAGTDAAAGTDATAGTDIASGTDAAQGSDTVALKDIVDIAIGNADFETLVAAVQAADLVATLKGPGPFTVFAPNDAAFAKIAKTDLDAILADKALLTSILTYHVVSGKVLAADVKPGKVKTVQGQELTVTSKDGKLFVDEAQIVATDILASNGVIHIIDTVITPEPPAPVLKDIVDTAIANSDFTTLVAAVQAADLVATLKGTGPFTVFAPNNAAFAKIAKTDLDAILADKALLTSILTYHVLAGKVLAADVKPGKVKTVQGQELTIAAKDGKLFVDEAQIIATDIAATNGVIHVIDTVITPEPPAPTYKDIVDTAIANADFTTLVTAVQAADLVATLKGTGPFTVFAPNNAAFAKIAESDLNAILADKALLTDILTYHVVAGAIYAKDVAPGKVETVQGTELTITIEAGKVFVDEAEVLATDITCTNGVIHVIDTVITPAPPAPVYKDIVDTAAANADFTTLVAAIEAADLVATLKGTGPFTVFAPNNDAFAKIAEADLNAILADKALLSAILTYHVVPGAIYAKDVAPGKVKTVLGQELTITSEEGGLFVDGAAILAVDITCTNGVIHVIDTVVLPTQAKTIAQVAAGNPAFSTLVGALTAVSLVDTLNSPGTFTVFAPTDDAFAALPEGALAALSADPTELTTTLLYHVLGATVLAADVETGTAKTLAGIDLAIEVTQGAVFVGNAMVTVTDIVCSNGVIHVIDKVLLPPSIVDIAAANDDFSTLVTALQLAELVETLQGDGPFTVFAPNNAAFAKIAEADLASILADKELLTTILTYHVVPGLVLSANIVSGKVTTVQGEELTIEVDEGEIYVNGKLVIAGDIRGKNGVIHVLGDVLLPTKAKTIAQVVKESADFSILNTALLAAELTTTLAGEGPFTVFAPTNAAFEAIDPEALTALLANPTKLSKTLLYHVLGSQVLAADVDTGTFKTVSMIDLAIEVTAGSVFVGTAKVTQTDIVCSNGVIHVIDAVLMPPSVVDLAIATADFSTLVSLLTAADLVTTLSGNGPFTVFAPVNSAFTPFSQQEVEALLGNIPYLTSILTYHVLAGEVPASAVTPGQIPMLNGSTTTITSEGGFLFINGTQIIDTDIYGWNGVIHVIGGVLLPPPG